MRGALVFLVLSSALAVGQVVCVGTDAQCRKAQAELCAKPEPANLDVRGALSIEGSFKDVTGAPLPVGYVAQLRNAATGAVLNTSVLDAAGRFNFLEVPARTDRLILVKMVNGVAQRFGFWQADLLKCDGKEKCELAVVLQVAPSDQPINQCPPK